MKFKNILIVLVCMALVPAVAAVGLLIYVSNNIPLATPTPTPQVEPITQEPEPIEEVQITYEPATSTNVPIPLDAETYYCIAKDVARVYQYPETTSAVIERFHYKDAVTVVGSEGEFLKLWLEDGREGYSDKKYYSKTGYEYPYVSVPNAEDLRLLIPDAEFDILFASENNITGHAMYAPIPILETTTANMLLQAADTFREMGYRLKIYDSYRPKWAQEELYSIVQDNRYIANPSTGGSWHNVGRAVDMSLIDIETGEELEMPTPMHTFNSTASRFSSSKWSEEARKNVEMMTDVMVGVGFKTIETEWWHFEYTGPGEYLDRNMHLDSGEYFIAS